MTVVEATIEEIIQQKSPLGLSVCQRLTKEINKLGFAAGEISYFPLYNAATFTLIKDPFTGVHNLIGHWFNSVQAHRIGSLQFNSDGSVYAEYDVIKPHPTNAYWFVESVTVWGNLSQLKAEAKLLPMPK